MQEIASGGSSVPGWNRRPIPSGLSRSDIDRGSKLRRVDRVPRRRKGGHGFIVSSGSERAGLITLTSLGKSTREQFIFLWCRLAGGGTR
jgi:hypothetical protein